MASFEVHKALGAVFDVLALANKHLQSLEPWASTTSPEAVHRSLYYSSETLRMTGILLSPFMPDKSRQLLDSLGVSDNTRTWDRVAFGRGGETKFKAGKHKVLFPPVKVPVPKV